MHATSRPDAGADANALPPAGLCTCSKVRGLARRLTGLYDAALAPHGLTVTQYAALAVLARAREPLTVSDLATRLQLDRTTTSRLVAPLESAGLVVRVTARGDDGDRRARPLGLTSSGRRRLRAAVPAWRAAQGEVTRLLGAPLHQALHRVAESAGRALAAAPGVAEDR
jgi:DNA-binding MarR family transcriptional regulator